MALKKAHVEITHEQLEEEQVERHRLEVKAQEIDDRRKSNTHRLDKLEGKVIHEEITKIYDRSNNRSVSAPVFVLDHRILR